MPQKNKASPASLVHLPRRERLALHLGLLAREALGAVAVGAGLDALDDALLAADHVVLDVDDRALEPVARGDDPPEDHHGHSAVDVLGFVGEGKKRNWEGKEREKLTGHHTRPPSSSSSSRSNHRP